MKKENASAFAFAGRVESQGDKHRPVLTVYVGLPVPRQFCFSSRLDGIPRRPVSRIPKVGRGVQWMLPSMEDGG